MLEDATRCHKMSHDATRCYKMPQDATRCHKMPHDATRCHKMRVFFLAFTVVSHCGSRVPRPPNQTGHPVTWSRTPIGSAAEFRTCSVCVSGLIWCSGIKRNASMYSKVVSSSGKS
ncbi:hypothetical protein RRG08_040687 [Elysia crispata]|uniref:Uncharacterized protein n=1 Tax=Elysia crispata TaxID=231223 RepID=A0AAE1AYZ9_9GAST|nr:hypothetical protein RRG08_040687 [Elysia crispata]